MMIRVVIRLLRVDTTAEAERIRDVIGAAVVAGTHIVVTVDDTGNTITIATDGAADIDLEQVMDAIATMLQEGHGISLVYNDAGDQLTVSVTGLSSSDISDFNTAIFAAAVRSTFSNTNKTMSTTEMYVAQTGTLTAPRTVTLPAASLVPAGRGRIVTDESGTCTATNTLSIARAGGDTINRATSPYIITSPDTLTVVVSDGVSNWTVGKANSAEIKQLLAGAGVRLTTSGDSTTADVIMQIDEWTTSVSSPYTYVKPANAIMAMVDIVGAGLPGAGGRCGAAGSIRGGGGGGPSGGHKRRNIAGTDLGANETVTLGAPGTPGTGGASTGADGTSGAISGNTSFGSHLVVNGDAVFFTAGKGTNAPGGAGGALNDSDFSQNSSGGSTSSTAAAGAGGLTNGNPGGGGGGGAIDA
jgi:hypothetical protein